VLFDPIDGSITVKRATKDPLMVSISRSHSEEGSYLTTDGDSLRDHRVKKES
jgi:hypothetical protein